MTAPIHALFLCAVITLSTQAGSERQEEPGAPADLTRTQAGDLAAPAMVNGHGPVAFIVDTGDSHTAVADGLAQELGYALPVRDHDVQSLPERSVTERRSLERLEALEPAEGVCNTGCIGARAEAQLDLTAWR